MSIFRSIVWLSFFSLDLQYIPISHDTIHKNVVSVISSASFNIYILLKYHKYPV
nr:hypothetical protein CJLB15_00088 [Campylobacter phage CJLB-15]